MLRNLMSFSVFVILYSGFAGKAGAQAYICNQSGQYLMYAYVSEFGMSDTGFYGWYTINNGECESAGLGGRDREEHLYFTDMNGENVVYEFRSAGPTRPAFERVCYPLDPLYWRGNRWTFNDRFGTPCEGEMLEAQRSFSYFGMDTGGRVSVTLR